MQGIILCPKCHVQVKKDNLGELLCPNCDARLCPKAHIFDGKICPYCGWEDPNYYLWQKAQKARAQSSVHRKPQESLSSKLQYVCPRCYTQVNTPRGVCPNQRGCGYSGPMQRSDVQKPATSATPTPMSKPTKITSRSYKSVPLAPSQTRMAPPRSPILPKMTSVERREWEFPSLRRFVRPVLASLLTVIILGGLIIGGIYVTQLVSQNVEPGTRPFSPPPTTSKTYTLSTSVIPEAGGEIKITSPSSSSEAFEPGSQITLTATPDDLYTFDHWEGASSSSETVTVTMDSDKSVIAHFKLKDTTPPETSSIEVSNVTDLCATITWLTDEPTTSQIKYGATKDYSLSAKSIGEPTTSHKIRLTELDPNTTYHYTVISIDASGNEATFAEDRTLTTLPAIPVGYQEGKRAPEFTLQDLSGKNLPLSTFQGKIVMVNFWATWCGPCTRELPYFQEVSESWPDDKLVILAINLKESKEAVNSFITNKNYTFTVLLDSNGEVSTLYKVTEIPKTFFIDADGIIRKINSGSFQNSEQIEEKLKSTD